MKTITLEKIDTESVEKVIDLLYNEDEVILILDCEGGSIHLSEILIKELNKNKDKVTMYGYSMLSAGFDVFNSFEGKKELTSFCQIMFHKADRTSSLLWSKDRGFDLRLEKENELQRFKYKNFLTKKELKQYDRGEEVWIIDEDRIKLIFGL